MKLRLFKSVLCSLVATFAPSLTVTSLHAQQSTATFEDWEINSEAQSASLTNIYGWIEAMDEARASEASIPTGSFLMQADGTKVALPENYKFIDDEGYFLDADKNKILENGAPILSDQPIILGGSFTLKDLWGTTLEYEAGSIMLPTAIDYEVQTANPPHVDTNTFAAGDYAAFNHTFSDGTKGTVINVGLTGYKSSYGVNTTNVTVAAGKSNENYGSADDRVQTAILFDGGTDMYAAKSAGALVGGNDATGYLGGTAEGTPTAHFFGDSTLIVKGFANVDFVVGGNTMYLFDSYRYSNYHADFTGDSKISLQQGTSVGIVVGGNLSGYSGSAYHRDGGHGDFVGDTTIIAHSSEVGEIVGGNYGSAGGSSFTGNSTIKLDGASFVNLIVGANLITQNENNAPDSIFTGSTYISIKDSFVEYEDRGVSLQGLFGGFNQDYSYDYNHDTATSTVYYDFSIDMQGRKTTLVGNTNISIDLRDIAKEITPDIADYYIFSGTIVGGSFAAAGNELVHTGDANLTIDGSDQIEFTSYVVGGNMVKDLVGNYTGFDLGPDRQEAGTIIASASIDNVKVTVNSGNFQAINHDASSGFNDLFVIGSMTSGGGNVTTKSATGTINGGLFSILIGGSAATANSIWGDGGSLFDTTAGSMSTESVTLNISGGSTKLIVGANYIDDEVNGFRGSKNQIITDPVSAGKVDVNITGGTHGNITSGSYISRGVFTADITAEAGEGAAYLIKQGDIKLNISGNNTIVQGDKIAGAGFIMSATNADLIAEFYFNQIGQMFASETLTPAESYTPTGSVIESTLKAETDSTTVSIGKNVQFENATTISGDYIFDESHSSSRGLLYSLDPSNMTESNPGIWYAMDEYFQSLRDYFTRYGTETDLLTLESWIASYNADLEKYGTNTLLAEGIKVIGNRQLVLNDGNYQNLQNASFVEFDEISIDADSTVNFSSNGQDLDLLNGRNILDGTKATTPHATAEGVHMIDTNTLRKTGAGTLILNDINGQQNKATSGAASNLQLVVEAGTVVLAKESAATSKTDFKTFVVQSGATLDMRAGNYDATTGKYLSGNAGINGDLRLETGSILRADASRDSSGEGTALEGGSLQIFGEGQVTLRFDNLDLVEANGIAEAGHLLFDEGAEYFQIVLFSGLDFANDLLTNLEFTETIGTFDGVEAKGTLASTYFEANFDLTDVYLVYNAKGDILLTGATFYIPEPSTATLSLLALAGLLARRRRKTA